MIIYGAGGHAHVVIDILETVGKKIDFIVDDNPEILEELGYKVVRPLEHYDEAIIAIGNCETRKRIVETMKVETYPTIVHPSAIVSRYATLGEGSVVVQGAIVQSCARVGRHCIVNTGSSVGHDSVLEDFVHVASHATLLGNVTVGECSWIGAGSVVCQGVHIGRNVMIGAGSVVTRDIPDNVTAFGSPCKVRHPRNMIKAVIFDFGGVLLDLDMDKCYENIKALGIDFSSIPLQTVGAGDKWVTMSVMRLYNIGMISTDVFLDTLLKHSADGTTRQQVVEAWNSCLLGVPQYKVDFIDELRDAGYATYVLSNTNDLHWSFTERKFGEEPVSKRFDHCFLSHEMGVMKPDVKIYEAMLKQIPYKAEECLFVDDLKANCEAAGTVGIRSLNVAPNTDFREDVWKLLKEQI